MHRRTSVTVPRFVYYKDKCSETIETDTFSTTQEPQASRHQYLFQTAGMESFSKDLKKSITYSEEMLQPLFFFETWFERVSDGPSSDDESGAARDVDSEATGLKVASNGHSDSRLSSEH